VSTNAEVGLAAEACRRFRHAVLAVVLFSLLQEAVEVTFLAVGATGAASWANEGAANATAATAAAQAIKRRMKTLLGRSTGRGNGAALINRNTILF